MKAASKTDVWSCSWIVLIFVTFLLVGVLKNAELLKFPAPYFEDGAWLFGQPRWDTNYSILEPMGAGYVEVFPRLYALIVGKFVPIEFAAFTFVGVCVFLKAVCAFTIYIFLRRVAAIGNGSAMLIAFLTLFVQSANFALDTLLINSIWNLTAISFFAVFLIHRLSRITLIGVTTITAVAIWSTVANPAIAAALASMIMISNPWVRSRLNLTKVPNVEENCSLYVALLILIALYWLFGVHYDLLALDIKNPVGQGFIKDILTFAVVAFERSFIEGVMGRAVRDLIVALPGRYVIDVFGIITLEAALLFFIILAHRRRATTELAWLVASFFVLNGISLMVVFSGHYHDGYGRVQLYYIQSVTILTIFGLALARIRRVLLTVFALLYLTSAAWMFADIHQIRVIGDPYTNHQAFVRFIAEYKAGKCIDPCVLSTPAVWAPPWTVPLGSNLRK